MVLRKRKLTHLLAMCPWCLPKHRQNSPSNLSFPSDQIALPTRYPSSTGYHSTVFLSFKNVKREWTIDILYLMLFLALWAPWSLSAKGIDDSSRSQAFTNNSNRFFDGTLSSIMGFFSGLLCFQQEVGLLGDRGLSVYLNVMFSKPRSFSKQPHDTGRQFQHWNSYSSSCGSRAPVLANFQIKGEILGSNQPESTRRVQTCGWLNLVLRVHIRPGYRLHFKDTCY